MTRSDCAPLARAVRDVLDFPKPGIVFKDITPVLADPALFSLAVDCMQEETAEFRPDKIAAIDARGFIFGAALAERIGVGFVPIRKRGKLPYRTRAVEFTLEYASATVEIHEDAVSPGERVLLVDDVLATGGTAVAAVELVQSLGGELVAALFFIELGFLGGRAKLGSLPVRSVLSY